LSSDDSPGSAGLYQINLIVPPGLGTGDLSLVAMPLPSGVSLNW
jgi:uncharacterized protein (TIGR03437 family)